MESAGTLNHKGLSERLQCARRLQPLRDSDSLHGGSDEGAARSDLLAPSEGKLESPKYEPNDAVGEEASEHCSDTVQRTACSEPDHRDCASPEVLQPPEPVTASTSPKTGLTDWASSTPSSPVTASTESMGEARSPKGENGLSTISSEGIAIAAGLPSTTSVESKLSDPPALSVDKALSTEIVESDMPPPSFLPRQLRMKRNMNRPPRTQAAQMSSLTVAAAAQAPTEAHEGQKRSATPVDRGSVEDEFAIFMKEIQQLDSQKEATDGQKEAEHQEASPRQGEASCTECAAPVKQHDSQAMAVTSSQVSERSQRTPECEASAESKGDQGQQQQAVWQGVLDPASGETYYWNTNTDEVTWELPSATVRSAASKKERNGQPQEEHDLRQWAATTFKLTQELSTCSEKVQQLMLQLAFIESELEAQREPANTAHSAVPSGKVDVSLRLQRFLSAKRQHEAERHKHSQEERGGSSDDELLKEVIDLQLQQGRQTDTSQCETCRERLLESRGTQSQQAKVRLLASSLARRLGNVEKEWASSLLAALKARLDDWIDGGLSSSFFLKRLERMQHDLQKHLSQDMKAQGHHHELASVFPYSAAAAAVSATSATKSSPRNCLAGAAAASWSDKASGSKAGSGRPMSALRIGAAAPRGSSKHSDDSPAVSTAPPTPAGPPPTLPDGVPPAKSEPAQAEVAPAADDSRRREVEVAAPAATRDGAPAPGVSGGIAKRPHNTSACKKISSSNPLVRKRMQLVEKWQKSREKEEESEEEDYEQRRERLKQKKLDEWKEREMASRRGMQNANFIEVTADWRSLVQKK